MKFNTRIVLNQAGRPIVVCKLPESWRRSLKIESNTIQADDLVEQLVAIKKSLLQFNRKRKRHNFTCFI